MPFDFRQDGRENAARASRTRFTPALPEPPRPISSTDPPEDENPPAAWNATPGSATGAPRRRPEPEALRARHSDRDVSLRFAVARDLGKIWRRRAVRPPEGDLIELARLRTIVNHVLAVPDVTRNEIRFAVTMTFAGTEIPDVQRVLEAIGRYRADPGAADVEAQVFRNVLAALRGDQTRVAWMQSNPSMAAVDALNLRLLPFLAERLPVVFSGGEFHPVDRELFTAEFKRLFDLDQLDRWPIGYTIIARAAADGFDAAHREMGLLAPLPHLLEAYRDFAIFRPLFQNVMKRLLDRMIHVDPYPTHTQVHLFQFRFYMSRIKATIDQPLDPVAREIVAGFQAHFMQFYGAISQRPLPPPPPPPAPQI